MSGTQSREKKLLEVVVLRQQNIIDMTTHLQKHIRRGQILEIFRSTFLTCSGANTTVSAVDLDELMRIHRVRPSAVICLAEKSAAVAGTVSKWLPFKAILEESVNSAVRDHFNDIIREMHADSQASGSSTENLVWEETRETFRYHRDQDCGNVMSKDFSPTVFSKGIYQILDISTKL